MRTISNWPNGQIVEKKTSCLAWKFSSSTNDLSRDEMIFRRGQRIIIVFPFSFFFFNITPDFRGFSKEKKPFFRWRMWPGCERSTLNFQNLGESSAESWKWKVPRWRVHDHGSIVWTEIIIYSLNERLYRWLIFFFYFLMSLDFFFYLTTIIEFKVMFFFFVRGRNKCSIKRGNWQTITIEMWSVKKNKLVSPLKPDLCIFFRQNYFLFPWPPRNITKDDLF